MIRKFREFRRASVRTDSYRLLIARMVVLLLLALLWLGPVSAAPVLSFQKGHVAGAELPAGVNLDRASTVRKVHSTVFTVPSCVLVNVECMCEVAVYLLLKATFFQQTASMYSASLRVTCHCIRQPCFVIFLEQNNMYAHISPFYNLDKKIKLSNKNTRQIVICSCGIVCRHAALPARNQKIRQIRLRQSIST